MDKQMASSPSLDAKPDRTLVVICTPRLVWTSWNRPYSIGATFTCNYSAFGSNPPMPNSVLPNGDLVLDRLPDPRDFNNNVDVTINLDTTQLFDHTGQNPVRGRWATSTEYSGTGPVTGFGWFCAVQNTPRRQYDTTPISVQGMSFIRLSDTQLMINDDTPNNGPDYAYCLGLVLPDYDNYYITLDPVIGGKGTTQK